MLKWDYAIIDNNWCSTVNSIFDSCSMFDVYENMAICDLPLCFKKIEELANAEWTDNVNSKPKLRTYKLFKTKSLLEKYVKINLSVRERSLLAQLRMGILPLAIELGRYRGIPADERMCFYCNNVVENEYHFVFDCHMYAQSRDTLMNYVNSNYDTFPH